MTLISIFSLRKRKFERWWRIASSSWTAIQDTSIHYNECVEESFAQVTFSNQELHVEMEGSEMNPKISEFLLK